MTLRYNPLDVFKASISPAGLYARQKWLNEQPTPEWQNDFATTTALLIKDQALNGSWRSSVPLTVKQLFGLHLTVRHATPQINKALDWLLEKAERQLNLDEGQTKELATHQLPEQLPFYQVSNALAHLDMPEAEAQLERAFDHLLQSQRPDGTWSIDQPEWHTFLTVHALKNKDRF